MLHADIKPGNIFLDKSHTVAKVADYGLSKCMCKSVAAHTFRGALPRPLSSAPLPEGRPCMRARSCRLGALVLPLAPAH